MCGARLDDWVNGSYVDVLLKRVVSVVLVLRGVGPVLRNGYGDEGQNVCCIASGEVKSQQGDTPGIQY